jgi:phosphoglycerate kinase
MKPKNRMQDLALNDKVVFVRADLNVPLKEGKISDDTRIKATLPTVEYLLSKNCTILLASHLGRPKGKPNPEFSLQPVADRLKEYLKVPVFFAKDCIGNAVGKLVSENQHQSCVILLENLRFYKEEEGNDVEFAKKLAEYADFYINDAFGTAHRAHASTYQVATLLPSAPGFLLEKEIAYLGGVVSNPKKPLITILGGSKVSTKLSVLKNLLEKSDKVLVGGGMIFTFFKAMGHQIGSSLCEDDFVSEAKSLIADYTDKLILPTDVVVVKEIKAGAEKCTVNINEIPADGIGVDIGEKSIANFAEILKTAATIVWNGPMGIFEIADFAQGTRAVCETIAGLENVISVVGGGDSVAAVNQMGYASRVSHISTGGGASLEFLEGKELPGVQILL